MEPFMNRLYILTGTDSRDNKQIKLHATYSRAYALWGPVPVPSAFSSYSLLQCPHINKKFQAVKIHKSLVIILNGRVCRRHPILHSYSSIVLGGSGTFSRNSSKNGI